MATPFIGQIKAFAFGYNPRYWAQCNGQLVSIAQSQALFSILGTQYGGNGTTNFALPDLRGRVAVHRGRSYTQGAVGGEERHQLSQPEIPHHTHSIGVNTAIADLQNPADAVLATAGASIYHAYDAASAVPLLSDAIAPVTGQAHENMQPFLTVNYCIALVGIYPSRN